MAGRLQGCSTFVTNQFPQAIYMHCNAHCLNLCIVAVSKIVDVKIEYVGCIAGSTNIHQSVPSHWMKLLMN